MQKTKGETQGEGGRQINQYHPEQIQHNKAHIEDDKVEEEHEDMEDKAGNALQLADYSLRVLQREGQVLPLLHHHTVSDPRSRIQHKIQNM